MNLDDFFASRPSREEEQEEEPLPLVAHEPRIAMIHDTEDKDSGCSDRESWWSSDEDIQIPDNPSPPSAAFLPGSKGMKAKPLTNARITQWRNDVRMEKWFDKLEKVGSKRCQASGVLIDGEEAAKAWRVHCHHGPNTLGQIWKWTMKQKPLYAIYKPSEEHWRGGRRKIYQGMFILPDYTKKSSLPSRLTELGVQLYPILPYKGSINDGIKRFNKTMVRNRKAEWFGKIPELDDKEYLQALKDPNIDWTCTPRGMYSMKRKPFLSDGACAKELAVEGEASFIALNMQPRQYIRPLDTILPSSSTALNVTSTDLNVTNEVQVAVVPTTVEASPEESS